MATVILDLSGTLPQTFTTGNWPASTMNTGTWRFVWTPTAASSSGTWSTGSLQYWALFSTNDANGGGLWLEHNGGVLTLQVVASATGAPISGATRSLTWTAGQAIELTINQSSGALTISGATTGNGTATYTPESILSAGSLTVGQWGSGGFTLGASTIGDVDDGVTGSSLAADAGSFTLTGSTAGLKVAHRLVADAGSFALTGANATLAQSAPLSLLGVFSASMIPALWWDRTLSPPAWFAIEAAAPPPSAGAYTLTADAGSFALAGTAAGLKASRTIGAGVGSYALTGTDAALVKVRSLGAETGSYTLTGADVGFRRALRLVAGVGAFTLTGTDAALTYSTPSSLALGDHGIDFQTYGSASRDAAVTLDTQASGSIVIIAAGGLLVDVDDPFTDNKSNTIQKIGSATAYVDWGTDYGVSMARTKPPMTGGTTHTFTVPVTLFSESTAFAIEVIGGGRVVGYSWINTTNTGAGATVTSDPVTAYEPVVWISFWWGAHPVFSPNTTPFQASAAGSGFTDLDSYLINNASGEVQAASAALVDTSPTVSSPVTKTVTWAHYPNQGAQIILIAVAAPARLTASDGTFTLTGSNATLRRTFNFAAGGGSFALTGSTAALSVAKTIGAGAGSYAVTGATAGLRVTRRFSCEAGSFAATGTDATLRRNRAIVAAAGSFAVSGSAAGLRASRKIVAAAGAFALTGSTAALRSTRAIAAAAGSFAVAGAAAGLRLSRRIVAAAGDFAVTGTAAALGYTRRFELLAGSFALAGTDAEFSVTDAGPAIPLPATLAITVRGETPFVVATFAGELLFTVAPAIVADFAIAGPGLFAIGADPGPFVVTRTDPVFTVTSTADAPFTVEEV